VNSGYWQKWIFKNPMACYASYYFENYFFGRGTPEEAVWACQFFRSFTPTAINYKYYMNDKGGRCLQTVLGNHIFTQELNARRFRLLFEISLCSDAHFNRACHELSGSIDNDWLSSTNGVTWLSTASPVVIRFLFRSGPGYCWTVKRSSRIILALPALSKVRSHWKFVDWLETQSGLEWLKSDQGLDWLISDPVFVYRKSRRTLNRVLYKNITDVLFIRKLIESDKAIRLHYKNKKVNCPFTARGHRHFVHRYVYFSFVFYEFLL
jgi:hypothetical protein